jgi:hypothetical protein
MRILIERLTLLDTTSSDKGMPPLFLQEPRRSAESVKAEGAQAYANGDHRRAIELFTLAVHLGGPPYPLHGNCSVAHAAMGQWSDALASAELMLYHCGDGPDTESTQPAHRMPDGRAAPNTSTLLGLPDDILRCICSELSIEELTRALRTCRRIHPPIQKVLRVRMAAAAAARRAKAHYRRACALAGLQLWAAAERACTEAIRHRPSPGAELHRLQACVRAHAGAAAREPVAAVSGAQGQGASGGPLDHMRARVKYAPSKVLDLDRLPVCNGPACLLFLAGVVGSAGASRPFKAVVRGKLLAGPNAVEQLCQASRQQAGSSRVVIQLLGGGGNGGDAGWAAQHPDDVDCVMRQTGVEREQAAAALAGAGGDLLQAIAQLGPHSASSA